MTDQRIRMKGRRQTRDRKWERPWRMRRNSGSNIFFRAPAVWASGPTSNQGPHCMSLPYPSAPLRLRRPSVWDSRGLRTCCSVAFLTFFEDNYEVNCLSRNLLLPYLAPIPSLAEPLWEGSEGVNSSVNPEDYWHRSWVFSPLAHLQRQSPRVPPTRLLPRSRTHGDP